MGVSPGGVAALSFILKFVGDEALGTNGREGDDSDVAGLNFCLGLQCHACQLTLAGAIRTDKISITMIACPAFYNAMSRIA